VFTNLKNYLNPMKNLILLICILFSTAFWAQQKLSTTTGTLTATTATETSEIATTNAKVRATFNVVSGLFFSNATQADFEYATPEQKTIFTTQIIDAERHTRTTLKGSLEKFDLKKISTSGASFAFVGTLQYNGKTIPIKSKATVKRKLTQLVLELPLALTPKDLEIRHSNTIYLNYLFILE
jgi:hypothetical protein